MNTLSSIPITRSPVPGRCPPVRLSWRAVAAGVTTTIAVQIVLMMLGAGIGLAAFNPAADGDGIASFGAGAAVVQGISAVLSLWAGGWIAGRFLGDAGERSGRLHGFIVWCAACVLSVLILATGAGWALGGLGKTVGGGLAVAGQPVVSGLSEMAKEAANSNKTMFSSFTEEGSSMTPTVKTGADSIRTKRELSQAIGRLFTADAAVLPARQQAVVKLMVEAQGVPEPDARRTVDGWVASYQTMKADADAAMKALEAKTREAAEKSANALAVLSLCYFAAFVLGAVSASIGGAHGGGCASRHHEACYSLSA